MAAHVIDFLPLGNNFGTPEMRAVWSEENRLRQQIEVEVALAKAEGELGVIPVEAAEKIAKSVDANALDFNQLADEAVKLKHCNANLVKRVNIFIMVQPPKILWIPQPLFN